MMALAQQMDSAQHMEKNMLVDLAFVFMNWSIERSITMLVIRVSADFYTHVGMRTIL